MAEKHQAGETFLRRHPEYFQKIVLVVAIKSFRFYSHVKSRLCPFEAARKGRRPDFQKMELNRVYGLVADFWDRWESKLDPAQDYSISLTQLDEVLRTEVNKGRMLQLDARNLFESLNRDLELVTFGPEVLAHFHRDPTLEAWLDRRSATNLIDLAYSNRTLRPPSLLELRRITETAQLAMSSTLERLVRGAELLCRNISTVLPLPTDIGGVNDATGGGLRPGTTTLIGGCNGSGKTVLAVQWAKHFALQGANVVLFTTEQPPEQLMVRALCNYLQVDFGELTNADSPAEIPLQQRRFATTEASLIPPDLFRRHEENILNFYRQVYSHLFFVDWSDTSKVIRTDFETEMSMITQTGWDPDVVIFDWIGGGLDNFRTSNLDLRLLYKEGIEALNNHGKRTNRVMIAMAQLNKTNVGPKKKAVVMADLAECKSMTDHVENFIGISALRQVSSTDESPNRVAQFLNVDKARTGVGGLVPVEADFRHQCFRYVGKGNHL